MPGEAADQMTDEDNLMAGKAMLLIAGGNARITEREREWLIGYLTAARDADWVIDAIATYDDSDTLDELDAACRASPKSSRGLSVRRHPDVRQRRAAHLR